MCIGLIERHFGSRENRNGDPWAKMATQDDTHGFTLYWLFYAITGSSRLKKNRPKPVPPDIWGEHFFGQLLGGTFWKGVTRLCAPYRILLTPHPQTSSLLKNVSEWSILIALCKSIPCAKVYPIFKKKRNRKKKLIKKKPNRPCFFFWIGRLRP